MDRCPHRHRLDGICLACGHCLHEVVLNRQCYFCGAAEVEVTVAARNPPEPLVPAASLVRRRRDGD